jgi:hypothetical protein|tara:strand:- start:54 stop:1124 length:1071 start_codon:yes stop_codon:yes gene_type:complete
MIKKLIFILLLFSINVNAQFLKYSTFYVSTEVKSPFYEQPRYMMDRMTGEFTDVSVVNPYNYKLNFGIRKIARFDYENKAKEFYDGSENNISHSATIGAVSGFEYNASLSLVRDRGNEFINQNYWLRYSSDYFLVKGDYQDKQEINLKHFGGEVRARIKAGKFNFTVGVKHRTHPVYGINPFEQNFSPEDSWWSIAFDLGYQDEYWFYDGEQNGQDDYYDYYNWRWYDPQGNLIAETDEEFMKYHFGRAIDEYNRRELKALGLQQELSAVAGVSFYHYNKNFWLHMWGDVMPYHHGLSEYSFVEIEGNNKILDFDYGIILGTKINTRLGLFIEGKYQRYWDIKNYELKSGINYLFL